MRPCQTCQCFVPVAAQKCPRCAAALEPVEIPEAAVEERDLVLVGAGSVASPLTGSGHGDVVTRSVMARVALPPIDGPAGRPRRPALPKLPQPFAPDPLVLAVFLGIPVRNLVKVAEPEPEAVADVEAPEAEVAPPLVSDTFSALLGTNHEDPLPATAGAAPVAKPTPQPVAVPVVSSTVRSEPLAVAAGERRRRFARRDPFARRSSRRERILTRICIVLVATLAFAVVALRLPIGARPELGASGIGAGGIGSGVSTPVTTPFDDGIQLETRADLRATIAAGAKVYALWKSYLAATPVVLHRALPQLSFVSATRVSDRVGQISVDGTAHLMVLAEYAGPGECAFARVVDRLPAEASVGASGGSCHTSAAPTDGWEPLGTA